jgi:predicted dehydrogenase
MRIAIAGLGAAARTIHVPACRRLDGVEIVGGCDTRADVRGFSIPVYSSLDDLLDSARPELLIVATPPESHFEIAATALRNGVNVLCEKPFANTVAEAQALLRIADESGVQIAVNNEFRFMRCHRAAKAELDSGRCGELVFMHAHQSFRTSDATEAGWRGMDLERTCKDFGTHVFDLCRYFFGTEPTRMRARMPKPTQADGPDLLNLIDLEFPGERFARITLDRLTTGRHRYLDIRLDGTRGTLETELGGHLAVSIGLRAAERRPFVDLDLSLGGRAFAYSGETKRKLASDPLDLFAAATSTLLAEFIAAIRLGTRLASGGHDNIRSFALVRAAYESARTGSDVDLAFLQSLA